MAVPDKRESNDTVPSNERRLPKNVAGRSRSKKPQEARGSHFTPEEPKIWVLSTKLLRYLYLSDKYKTVTTETAVGFLLPIPTAERWCLFTLPKEESHEQRMDGSLPDNADRGPEGQ
jgi:hypothetical protein